VEYTRKKGADLVVTCSVIPTTERHNSQATFNVRVTNKGPDKCPVASIDLWARLFDNEAVADLTTGRRDPRPGHGFRMVSEFANHSRLGRLPLGGGSLEAGVLYYQWPNFEKDDDVVAITIIVRHVAPRGMTGSGTVFLQGNVTGSITDPSLENNEIQGDGSYADFYDPRIDAR
jgi:hypothetical protein